MVTTAATAGAMYCGYQWYQSKGKEENAKKADDQVMPLVNRIIKMSNSNDPKVIKEISQEDKKALLAEYARLKKPVYSVEDFSKAIDKYNKKKILKYTNILIIVFMLSTPLVMIYMIVSQKKAENGLKQ